ncbi:MAG TPA: histidinol-phosphate transaminase [Anaeromyxobacteraceae bacterium]|nr:histidinol-phosphate transaminase [Anaeromyxobacteraceae bacterium]
MSWRERLRESIWALGVYRPFDYATARKDLVRLDANESPYPFDKQDLEAFQEEIAKLPFERYPEVSGKPLREALARRYDVEPDSILVGNGSDEIISILVTAFAGARDGAAGKVLFPTPTFGEFEQIPLAHGARTLPVPLGERFELDEPRLTEVIRRERPALAFFASPNNPTGNRFDAGALERLAGEMDAVLVADEAYADFSGAGMAHRIGKVPGLFVMRSLSKIGFAGMRLGALLATREVVAELDKVRLPYNVNAVSMALACAALAFPDRVDARIRRIAASRRALEEALRQIPGLTVFPSEANFVLVRTPGDAKRVWDRLLERGVLVRYLSRPGPLERCLRITAGTCEENETCLQALRAILD